MKFFSRRVEDPQWYKKAVGGMWQEIGELQFNFLLSQGLKPTDYFLDIGCGSLRGGIHFIKYLRQKHYFGTDIDEELLKVGKGEIRLNHLNSKNPTHIHDGDFELTKLGRKFHYVVAISVFTHLPLNDIIKCILNVEKVLYKNGRFYATFFENGRGKFNLKPLFHHREDGSDIKTFFNKDPFHYDRQTFRWICKGTTIKVKYLGDWKHPRSQKMLMFTKA